MKKNLKTIIFSFLTSVSIFDANGQIYGGIAGSTPNFPNVGINTSIPMASFDVAKVGGTNFVNFRVTRIQPIWNNGIPDCAEIGIAENPGNFATCASPGDKILSTQGGGNSSSDLILSTYNNGNNIRFGNNNTEQMTLNTAGQLLIGFGVAGPGNNPGPSTLPAVGKLGVKGSIYCTGVVIENLSGMVFPDFVFKKDYKLMPIMDVEKFIKKEGHLPEIPSASDVEKKGLNLAEMDISLLKKVEELTLYMIEMKKENELIKKEIKEMKVSKK